MSYYHCSPRPRVPPGRAADEGSRECHVPGDQTVMTDTHKRASNLVNVFLINYQGVLIWDVPYPTIVLTKCALECVI